MEARRLDQQAVHAVFEHLRHTADPRRYITTNNIEDSDIWYSEFRVNYVANRLNLVLKHAVAMGLSVDLQAVEKARVLLGKQRHEVRRKLRRAADARATRPR